MRDLSSKHSDYATFLPAISGFMSKTNTYCCKYICPLTTPALSRFKKLNRMLISYKPSINIAFFTLVVFNPLTKPLDIFLGWFHSLRSFFVSHFVHFPALVAWWFVNPFKVLVFEPIGIGFGTNWYWFRYR